MKNLPFLSMLKLPMLKLPMPKLANFELSMFKCWLICLLSQGMPDLNVQTEGAMLSSAIIQVTNSPEPAGAPQDSEPSTKTAATQPKSTQDPADLEQAQELFASDFDGNLDAWQFSDANAWKLDREGELTVLSQFVKSSRYQPKHRSPLHQAILKDQQYGSFDLSVDVLSTHQPYGHRDACLFFGYQNPNQFYYVHLGQTTDPHCNQIFIVNNADRTKITASTTAGTPWDDRWHQVRILRCVETGKIEVYFDDQTKPAMTAQDKTFGAGQIGLGSFDDTADWAKLRIRKLETTANKEETPESGSPQSEPSSSNGR